MLHKTIAIVGAGFAGAACANAFAHAGWRVTVYEKARQIAAGASGVPLALFAPSVSADDAPHSRFLRRGVHLLLGELERLTQAGLLQQKQDWAMTGVLERCIRTSKNLPSIWLEPQDSPELQSRVLGKADSARAGEQPMERPLEKPLELWHGAAGWVKSERLIEAWLTHPLIQLKTNVQIEDVTQVDADVMVIACGHCVAELLPELQISLQPIRGQVEWSASPIQMCLAGPYPINGMGHFIQTQTGWLAGATFQRDEDDVQARSKDVNLNFEKLAVLLPELDKTDLQRLRAESNSWVGVRVAQKNRQPLIQKIATEAHSNVWVCAGLGSRGLSLAALCASRLLASIENSLALR